MNDDKFIKSLERAVSLSKEGRIEKIIKLPWRIIFSKILTFFSLYLKKTFRIKTKTFFGEKMNVVLPETVSAKIYNYGFFEEGLTRIILKYLKSGMTFFDIGAHFGYFTLLGSTIVGQNGEVHSFEPTSSTFDILKSNTLNRKNVTLNNCAVYSSQGTTFINDYGIKYSAFNSLYQARLSENTLSNIHHRRYETKTVSIDDYVEYNNLKPDFIKIDAESSEFEILLGISKTIKKFRPIITIEVGDQGVKDIKTSQELINFLINKDYQPYEFKEDKILRHIVKDIPYEFDNILFLPDSNFL